MEEEEGGEGVVAGGPTMLTKVIDDMVVHLVS